MIHIVHDTHDSVVAIPPSTTSLWLDASQVHAATGWEWKPQGLCRGAACMPIPPAGHGGGQALVDGARLDLAAFWRHLGWPAVHDDAGALWVLGEGADSQAAAWESLQAPDFELPDLAGRMHRLSDLRGQRVFMATWASWCGCRVDLALWQALQASAGAHGFTVLAIALDDAASARPWIEAAAPTFPCLIDAEHLVAQRYNLVNVPQAVWIDEEGRIVRPPESAGSTDGLRERDRQTNAMPEAVVARRAAIKATYLDAVRDWAEHGAASRHALAPQEVRRRLQRPDAAIAEAHARFRLGQSLLRAGQEAQGRAQLDMASRLHPDSWAIWRQHAERDARGLAVSPAFWERVDALGDKPYYPPAQL
ncbi:TlpA disulfide reductase family protein [Pseudorhodoferax sp. Leaf274]|uniref:TlpA disulfide reductase family protein n=1 Tax=Pseudorhodoferax sp. Leaf274 TaxID=1736318 RepID=UPI000703794D|nr:TlpA disulfide reductase family protein [Pseudorhodoferax sp. Leaf274]KQP44624.1 hypothetical protein ASF44_27490 [Pseudorhodoferax sp. Leaf274]